MRNTKLYNALIRLNGFELNRLHRFLVSPYFNRNQSIIQLFELIKEDIRNPGERELTKEEIWRSIMGNVRVYNDGHFRKLQSDLLSLIESFYAQESFESNPIQKANYLMKAIYTNNLIALEASAIKDAKKISGENVQLDASRYFYNYELERNIYFLARDQSERSEKSNVENIVKNLDKFFLAEKLRYFAMILTHQHFAAVDYEMLFIDEILDHVKNHDYSDVPAILIYYQIILTYKDPKNNSHYEKLKDYLDSYIANFSPSEAKEIFDAALNYLLIRANSGEIEYVRKAFNLYIRGIESGLMIIKGLISPWAFKNIVTAGLRLSEFEWVENFISKYGEFLDPVSKKNAITFNLAQLHFYKKDYKQVIELLSQVEYEDFTYNLNSKTLLMASYFELDELDALNSLLDAFRLYVQRNNKLTKGKGSHYLHTISLVRKMAKIIPGDSKAISKLEKEIESTQGIVSKNWIMEKLEALKKDAKD